ncbi:AraC family transcriptional regulator [Paenibacillus oryzisoli]|uniref:helix-turn-helix domain-containing protein n=1 Tax=Paenibacillus oryzisoli TaxID=1850517 RepID=UPI003D2C5EDA
MQQPASIGDAVIVPYIRQADYASRLPWSYGERRILDYLLVYIESGLCRFTVNRHQYELRAGDFCLVQPGDLLLLEGLTETRTPFAHLDFFYNPVREQSFPTSTGMINLEPFAHLLQPRLNDLLGMKLPIVFQPPQPVWFKNKLLRMIGKWMEGTLLGRIEAQLLGTELLLELLRMSGALTDNRESPSALMDRVTAYLSLHLSETITVKQMAALVHLSPSRFNVVFRDMYGMSPYRYLLELRIERAIEMMKQAPELRLSQIALYCGFQTVQHFSGAFRNVIGMTPSAFRESLPS